MRSVDCCHPTSKRITENNSDLDQYDTGYLFSQSPAVYILAYVVWPLWPMSYGLYGRCLMASMADVIRPRWPMSYGLYGLCPMASMAYILWPLWPMSYGLYGLCLMASMAYAVWPMPYGRCMLG